jgi:hypothetical protein
MAWFREHGRDLPWRETSDADAILVGEVMAQQTQVERVVPSWRRWPSDGRPSRHSRARRVRKLVVADLQGNPEPVASAFREQLGKLRTKDDSSACERLPMISQPSGWPMTVSSRRLCVAATEGLEQLLSLSRAKSFGGSRLPLETIREKVGAAPRRMISATRSAGHASRSPARFRCKSSTTEFTNPTDTDDTRTLANRRLVRVGWKAQNLFRRALETSALRSSTGTQARGGARSR